MIDAVGQNFQQTIQMPGKYNIQPNRSNLSTLQKPDEFVANGNQEDKKKKVSTKAAVGIGAGILTIGGIIAGAILSKVKTLKPANFAEHIDFKPAQTMQEAIEYAKKNC